ncbi:MAG: asparagine synthase-related protein [Candidatus Binatia bacterium]
MAFIAGYVGQKINSSALGERVNAFQIMSGDESSAFDISVTETPSGHFISKYKKNYPIKPSLVKNTSGNVELTLGFKSPGGDESEGEFVSLVADKTGRIQMMNDRFATRPFYILKADDYVYFSSNIAFLLRLAGRKYEPDIEGWLQVFTVGHTIGTRTTFKNIKKLGPATRMTISPNGAIEEKEYWRVRHEPLDVDPDSHAEAVFEAFKAGMSWRTRLVEGGVLALSGGLDSRLVAATAPRERFSAYTFVTGSEISREARVATEVANALGLDHSVRKIPVAMYSDVADDVVRLTGGQRPLHHMAIVMAYMQELRRTGMNFLMGGGPGDLIAGSHVPSADYLDPSRTDACIRRRCQHLLRRFSHLGLLFGESALKEHKHKVEKSLAESFEEIEGVTAAHKATAWDMRNRWPNFTFTSLIHNHSDATEAFAHTDYRFCDLMLKLPAQWLYKRNFYSHMIYHCIPQLRHVIYANTGSLLEGRIKHFTPNRPITETIKDFLPTDLMRKLRGPNKGARGGHYLTYINDGRLISEVEEVLRGLPRSGTVLDVDKCLKFVGQFRDDRLPLSYHMQGELIGSLISLCLSHKNLG